MPDPFDITQYKTSFTTTGSYRPQTFAFANFPHIFTMLAEQIKMRQAAIQLCFNVPANLFINVDLYDISTPAGITAAVELFQDAIRQFTEGDLIDSYGKMTGCPIYIGFFSFVINGLPILGMENVMPDGDFTSPPDPAVVTNRLDFAREVGTNINEIILSLNALQFIHGPMFFEYPFDDSCTIDIDSSIGSSEDSSIGSSAGSSENSSNASSVNSSQGSSAGSSFNSSDGSSAGSSFGTSNNSSPGSSAGSSFNSSENSSFNSSANSSANSSPGSSVGSSPDSSENSSFDSSFGSTEGEDTSPGSSAGSTEGEFTSPGSGYGSTEAEA